jgi:hypothetical protein
MQAPKFQFLRMPGTCENWSSLAYGTTFYPTLEKILRNFPCVCHQWIKLKEKKPWKKRCDKRALSAFPGDSDEIMYFQLPGQGSDSTFTKRKIIIFSKNEYCF